MESCLPYAEWLAIEDSDEGIQAVRVSGMLVLAVGAAKDKPQTDYRAENLGDRAIRRMLRI